MIIIQKEWFSPTQCQENPQNLYIFGDNTKRFGQSGQACIRFEPNTFGIATKFSPSTSMNSYFVDSIECLEIIEDDIRKLLKIKEKYENIVFPFAGLGSGLSDMPNKCPLLYKRMNKLLNRYFEIDYK